MCVYTYIYKVRTSVCVLVSMHVICHLVAASLYHCVSKIIFV